MTTNAQPSARQNTIQHDPYQDDLISLSEILEILIKGKGIIAAATALFAICSLVYLVLAEPQYKSSALLQIEPEASNVISGITVANESEILRSEAILSQTVQKLGSEIVVEPVYFPVIGAPLARRFLPTPSESINNPVLGLASYAWGGENLLISELNLPGALIEQPLTLVADGNSRFTLKLNDKQLLSGNVGQKVESSDGSIQILVEEMQARDGTTFQVSKVSLGKAIRSLRDRLSVSVGKNTSLVTVSLVGSNVEGNDRELNTLVQTYEKWVSDKVVKAINRQLLAVQEQVKQSRVELAKAEAALEEFRRDSGSSDLSIEAQQNLIRLSSEVEVATEAQARLMNQEQQLKITELNKTLYMSIVDAASNEGAPIKPKKALIFVLAVLLGGMLGTGLVFVREMLNQGVKSAGELESKTDLPVMAVVPETAELKELMKQHKSAHLLSHTAPDNPALESLRVLRTNLVYTLSQADNKRIMISSPESGSGKSFVSANLASLLAESGQKILLVDADLRQGRQHETFQLSNHNGLVQWLEGSMDSQVIQPVNEKLDVLTVGKYPENPSELLMSQSFASILEEVEPQYDVILLDTPSSLTVTDPAIVGRHCATSIMAVRARHNTLNDIEGSISRLNQAGVSVNGFVLNGVAT